MITPRQAMAYGAWFAATIVIMILAAVGAL